MSQLSFTIDNVKASPAGSKRSMRHYRTNKIVTLDACLTSREWKGRVAGEASIACREQEWSTTDFQLVLVVVFTIARPASHYRRSKKLGVATVRDDAPEFHTHRPDALKLLRAVEDALTGIVYFDDAQLVVSTPVKKWGHGHSTKISVRRATPADLVELPERIASGG